MKVYTAIHTPHGITTMLCYVILTYFCIILSKYTIYVDIQFVVSVQSVARRRTEKYIIKNIV